MADFIVDAQGNVKDVRAGTGRGEARTFPRASPAVGAGDWWRPRPSGTTWKGWLVLAAVFVGFLGIGCLLDVLAGRNPFEWSREESLYEQWEDEHRLDIELKRREIESEDRWRYDPERRNREVLGLPEPASGDEKRKPRVFELPQTDDRFRPAQDP